MEFAPGDLEFDFDDLILRLGQAKGLDTDAKGAGLRERLEVLVEFGIELRKLAMG